MSIKVAQESARRMRKELDNIIELSRLKNSPDMRQIELSCVNVKKLLWDAENIPETHLEKDENSLKKILENTVRIVLAEKKINLSKKRINDITNEFYEFICSSITESNDIPYRVEFHNFVENEYGSITNIMYHGNRNNLKMIQQNDIPPEVRRMRDEGQDSE